MAERFNLNLFDPLKEFEERLPYTVRCSETKRPQHILPREKAKAFRYIQVNYPHIDYIVYDCDYPEAFTRAMEMDIAEPTLAVVTRETGHAHLFYEIMDPIPRWHSEATELLLRHVTFAYKELLCADKFITTQKQLVKNALSFDWDLVTGHKPFTLTELAESVPGEFMHRRTTQPPKHEPLAVKPFDETLVPYSRNCSIFENVRFYAYSIVHSYSSYDALYQAVLNRVVYLNDVEIPKYIPVCFSVKIGSTSELRSIARSVAGWTWDHRDHFRTVNRNAMGFPSMRGTYWEPHEWSSEVTRRQSLSARRTNEMRRDSTRQKIQKALELCHRRGLEPSVSNVSALAGVHRATVYRHRSLLDTMSHTVYSER